MSGSRQILFTPAEAQTLRSAVDNLIVTGLAVGPPDTAFDHADVLCGLIADPSEGPDGASCSDDFSNNR